jgi:hypothetical protein
LPHPPLDTAIESGSTVSNIDLESMTKDQLIAYAQENNIEGIKSSMTKAQITEVIKGAQEDGNTGGI